MIIFVVLNVRLNLKFGIIILENIRINVVIASHLGPPSQLEPAPP